MKQQDSEGVENKGAKHQIFQPAGGRGGDIVLFLTLFAFKFYQLLLGIML